MGSKLMVNTDILIIGSGLAGLSSSFHLGHSRCLILEAKSHPFGHIHSELLDGFTWDEGPHVSFTSNDYVRELFAESVEQEFEEYEVVTGNYYKGSWIEHPAQSNLYQVPETLRKECLKSFLNSRKAAESAPNPNNYKEWLHLAFGEVFAENFPRAYTRKYWTVDPVRLGTDWVGGRVFKPSVDDVIAGSKGPLDRQTHYIKKVRYPRKGGYQSFAHKLIKGAKIRLNNEVAQIDLNRRLVKTTNGTVYSYRKLINTMPLPVFVDICEGVPQGVLEASKELLCSSIQLVNVTAPHETLRNENWMYVYDEDKYAVRINCTEKLSPENAPVNSTGVQVEVYHSREKPLNEPVEMVQEKVVDELIEMGLVCPEKAGGRNKVKALSRMVPWANVVFHHETKPALEAIPAFQENPYVVSKVAATRWIEALSAVYPQSITIGKVFQVYGPGDDPNNVLSYAARTPKAGEKATFGSGQSLRDWIYIDDFIEGLIACGADHSAGLHRFDLGSGERHSIREMVELIAEIAGADHRQLEFDASKDRGDGEIEDWAQNMPQGWSANYSCKMGVNVFLSAF